MLGNRPRDLCKPGVSELAYQSRKLEQGYRLERRMEDDQKEGFYVQRRRVPITDREFQSLCHLQEEGTFMAQRGLWRTMERSWWISKMEGQISLMKYVEQECFIMKTSELSLQGSGSVEGMSMFKERSGS